ncbi:MAG: hypothetical protein HKO59_06045 [Phycisphaerales bacterium]|nr:hypothetical protein [Phycisphaerae bacterium]NNF43363.1 hypothetical protein [Phycisphaerales bacterium]NNM25534.1 hypothetical protein [Phycisphaerales bacterium]
MEQAYVQSPQFMVMPVAQRNGLGAFGFFVALIGLFIPTGIVAFLGLILSLAAIGRAPRGFATAGVMLGLLGTLFWAALMLVAIVVGLVAVVGAGLFAAGAFVMVQPEVIEITGDMVNTAIAVEEYRRDHDEIPEEMAGLSLALSATIDPWGQTYKLVNFDDDPGYDVVSSGPDQAFDTDDDVRLSRLDRLWESAFDRFDERMEEFGRRVESLEGFSYSCSDDSGIRFNEYERRARKAIGGSCCPADTASEAAAPAPVSEPTPADADIPPVATPRTDPVIAGFVPGV